MNEPSTVHGPYDTAAQARADAAPLTEAIRAADPGFGPMTDQVRAARLQVRADYLTSALTGAGVELGAYDRRIAAWLADWETETLQVLVGWIERAHAAGNLGAGLLAARAEGAVCGRCRMPFDPTDTRFDGRAEERSMPGYCRGCVDRCHDSEDAFHVCVICRPPESGQRDGSA